MLDAASEVCGYTKGKPRYFERWCGAIKMWMWLCVERENYLGFGNKAGMRKIGKNIVRQKKGAKKAVYMAMYQKAQEAVEEVDLCRDGRELFRIA